MDSRYISILSISDRDRIFQRGHRHAYFPPGSDFASLMFSMTTFAVGFMVRPLGAIFLGAYIDHIGRRKGLLVTAARKHHPRPPEIYASMLRHWRIVIIGVAMVLMTTVSFYTITAYTPTFGKEVLKLSQSDALLVTLCVGLSNLFWLPVMGSLSDRLGGCRSSMPAITVRWSYIWQKSSQGMCAPPAFRNRAIPGAWLSLAAAVALIAIWLSRTRHTASGARNATPRHNWVA